MDLADIHDPVEKYETMSRCANEAQEAGYDAVWLYDHFHTVPTPQLESVFECWTSIAALARDTTTIRLGQMVTCNSYRPPSLLAKMASGIRCDEPRPPDPGHRRRLVRARVRGLRLP